MTLWAIDPGQKKSAVVEISGPPGPTYRPLVTGGILDNEELLLVLALAARTQPRVVLALEMIASYGMPVGAEVFETCVWIGRFIQAWHPAPHALIFRRDVKLHLCGSARAKDAHIRAALLDRFGGKAAIGKKATPGPLYGFKSDIWAALAVALTFLETTSAPAIADPGVGHRGGKGRHRVLPDRQRAGAVVGAVDPRRE